MTTVVSKTVLTDFIDKFSGLTLEYVTREIYQSAIAQILIMAAFFIAIIHLAYCLRDGSNLKGPMMFLVSWLLCMPINQKPAGFIMIDALSKNATYLLDLANKELINSSIPPGYVANAIARASVAELTDPELTPLIDAILTNCIPDSKQKVYNATGKPLSALDLLIPRQYSPDRGPTFNISATVLNGLKERDSGLTRSNNKVSCFDAIHQLHHGAHRNMMAQDLTTMPYENIANVNSEASEPIDRMALNIAHGNSIRIKALERYEFLFPEMAGSRLDSTVANTFASQNFSTKASFFIQSAVPSIARALGVEHSWDNAKAMNEIDEKMRHLPYYISVIKIVLTVIAPLAFLALMTGSFKITLTWAAMWVSTDLFPVITSFCRSLTNKIIIAVNDLPSQVSDYVSQNQREELPITHIIDLDAISRVIEDSSKLLHVMLTAELTLYGILSGLLLAGSWFGGNLANSLSLRLGGYIANAFAFRGTSSLLNSAQMATRSGTSGPLSSMQTGYAPVQETSARSRMSHVKDDSKETSSGPMSGSGPLFSKNKGFDLGKK